MASTQIFADEIAWLVPDARIRRLRDKLDVLDLAALLATAFGVGQLQIAIAAELTERKLALAIQESTASPKFGEAVWAKIQK